MKKNLVLMLVLALLVSTFAVVSFALPTLTMSVAVRTGTLNVTYTAILDPASNGPQLVKFYTDKDTLITLFPTTYVGSAYTNSAGIATLSFTQAPGKYIGGAVCNGVYSNVCHYIVP